jgi:SAM-dependent methyltransferase
MTEPCRLRAPGRAADAFLVWLFRRFPPHETIFKDPAPRAQQEYDDEQRFPFARYFGAGPELLGGRDVLDLGCGFGGRPVRFAEIGARSVHGLEIDAELVARARRFAAARSMPAVTFDVGFGERIPCDDASFDLITMNDVMEHVIDPQRVLAECHRVLHPGGRLAVVFPPYYSFHGGSHLQGYATRAPGLNLLFPTRVLKRAAARRLREQGIDPRPFLREVPTDKLWNQNGLTVRGFAALVERGPFVVEQQWLLGHLDHRLSEHRGRAAALRRPMFLAAEAAARMPLLREAACLRIAALLRRPQD